MTLWWILLLTTLASLLLTGLLRRYAFALHLVDVPNERSSHRVPTPRGGGAAIIAAFLAGLAMLGVTGIVAGPTAWALLGAGGLVAVVGWLDDYRHIPAGWRLLVHFTGAIWAVAWMGGLPPLPVFGRLVDLGWLSDALAAVYLVWLLNLYNFMDGIDGIAAIEAVTVCLGAAVLYAVSPSSDPLWLLPVLLSAAVAGFLFWNFPVARIFMGDVGSGFLGIALGLLSLQAAQAAPELFWSWVILLGGFVVDATVTLVRRIVRGEPFYEAHRSHAYQYASRRLGAHPPISLAFGAINLLWLLPIAVAVATRQIDGVIGVAIAYAPLIWLALRLKAGAPELQEI